jgi:hypothetical protein
MIYRNMEFVLDSKEYNIKFVLEIRLGITKFKS